VKIPVRNADLLPQEFTSVQA
jgi:hypothetical protein